MKISAVIPTFERVDKLEACIDSLARQGDNALHEAIVVDDGSQDGTAEWLAAAQRQRWPFALRSVQRSHAGPAAARNAGVAAATGDVVFFTGDDCVLAPGCLAEHQRSHTDIAGLASVLGFTTWHPGLRVTPFMHFQENGGSQFAYWRIEDPEDAGWLYYYTTNISTPRELLLEHPFDERFSEARYEDLELGYRLEAAGARIVCRPAARVWHDHPIAFREFCARSAAFGGHAALFHRIHSRDEALARLLGIRDAEQATVVFGPGLQRAARLVEELEPLVAEAPAEAFGVRGATVLLHDAYRLLIHHALIRGIRAGLGMPAPQATRETPVPRSAWSVFS